MSTTTISPLRQRMIEDMTARKFGPASQRSHIESCERFAAYLKRSPATATPDDVKAVPRKIELGPVSGDLTVITTGLNDGDRVVADGQYKLQVGAPVAIVTAATAENVK